MVWSQASPHLTLLPATFHSVVALLSSAVQFSNFSLYLPFLPFEVSGRQELASPLHLSCQFHFQRIPYNRGPNSLAWWIEKRANVNCIHLVLLVNVDSNTLNEEGGKDFRTHLVPLSFNRGQIETQRSTRPLCSRNLNWSVLMLSALYHVQWKYRELWC